MKTLGRVNGIISNIVIAKVDGAVGQNEICYVYCGETRMMAEVIKVIGDDAYVQVYDSTRGLKIGDKVEFVGHTVGDEAGVLAYFTAAHCAGRKGDHEHHQCHPKGSQLFHIFLFFKFIRFFLIQK